MTRTADEVQSPWNDYWSRYAAEYDEHQLARLARAEERETWTRVWASVLPPGTRSVLDVGAGSGNIALLLAGEGFEVTGIDLSAGMLAQARSKLHDHPHPPTFVLGDAVEPPFAPGSFDAIVSRYLLWTLRDAPTALGHWHELLRPGGVLVAVDAPWFEAAEELPRETERQQHFAEAYSAAAFRRLPFGRAGTARIRAEWEAAGFVGVRVDALPDVLELDRSYGVAPGHAPEMQYRFSARRAH